MKELRLQYEIDPTFFLGMKLLPSFCPRKSERKAKTPSPENEDPKGFQII
jgi:hypothetical protein